MHKQEKPFPASLSFIIDNPIRRWQQPPSELINKLGVKPTDVVMDFGCGPGFFTFEIAKRAKQAVAVDISNEMLKKVQSKATKSKVENIQFILSDGKNINIESQTVNIVLLVTVYHEIQDYEAVLKEFSRVLRPNGNLAIVEVVRKSRFISAPVQDADALKREIEGTGLFKLKETLPNRGYSVFIFDKDYRLH